MPKNFARRTFDRWLRQNRRHFRFQPRVVKSRRDFCELRFDGIAPELSWIVTRKGDCMVTVYYNDTCWDIIVEFDLFERRNSKGQYFCDGCLPEYKKFYPSRTELWVNHCFKPLLEWANETFNTSNLLYICGKEGSYTAAYIKPESEMENMRSREELLTALPVVQQGNHDENISG